MTHHFIINEKGYEPRHLVLDFNRIGVGRGRDNQIQVNSEAISSSHIELVLDDENHCWIEDLDTINGTLLNGKALNRQQLLEDGDRILLANRVALQYLQLSSVESDYTEPVTAFHSHHGADCLALNQKMDNIHEQIRVLNKQYSKKLDEFQLLLVTLEQLKLVLRERLENQSETTALSILQREISSVTKRLKKKGIRVDRKELAEVESESRLKEEDLAEAS